MTMHVGLQPGRGRHLFGHLQHPHAWLRRVCHRQGRRFRHAHGLAIVLGNFSGGAALDVAHGYLALVIPDPEFNNTGRSGACQRREPGAVIQVFVPTSRVVTPVATLFFALPDGKTLEDRGAGSSRLTRSGPVQAAYSVEATSG